MKKRIILMFVAAMVTSFAFAASISWGTSVHGDGAYTYPIPAVSPTFHATYGIAYLVQGSDPSVFTYDETLSDQLSATHSDQSYVNAVGSVGPAKSNQNGDNVMFDIRGGSTHVNISSTETLDYFFIILMDDADRYYDVEYEHYMISSVKKGIGYESSGDANTPLIWTAEEVASFQWQKISEPFTSQTFTATTAEGYELNYKTLDATTAECLGLVNDNTAGAADLVIPATVSYGGVDYAVTSIGTNAFVSCSGFTGGLVISERVTSIGTNAFLNCTGFTGELIIPASVESIGANAFLNCDGFTGDLVIPASVESIEFRAFCGCSGFTELEVAEGNTHYVASEMMLFTKDMTTLVMCLPAKTGKLVIPDGVTSIETKAFSGCSGLTGNLVIPDGVEYIESEAFGDCSGINGKLVIPASVKRIEHWAFYGCSGLTSVTNKAVMPQELIEPGMDDDPMMAEMESPFKGVPIGEIPLYVPAGSEDAYNAALIWKDFQSIEAIVPEQCEVAYFVEGSTARQIMEVEGGANVAYRITAELGYEIESVTVNGTDVTSSLSAEGKLSIENIIENKVVLVKTKAVGGTDAPQASAEADFTAWGAQRTAYVEATQDMEQVRIIDLEGRVVYTAAVNAYSVMQVQMPQAGAYVVQAMMKDGTLKAKKIML